MVYQYDDLWKNYNDKMTISSTCVCVTLDPLYLT